jgi:hypothetical protein
VTLRVPEDGPAVTAAELKGMRLWTPCCTVECAPPAAVVEAEAVDATTVPAPAATRVTAASRTAVRDKWEERFGWEELFIVVEVKLLIRISEALKTTCW